MEGATDHAPRNARPAMTREPRAARDGKELHHAARAPIGRAWVAVVGNIGIVGHGLDAPLAIANHLLTITVGLRRRGRAHGYEARPTQAARTGPHGAQRIEARAIGRCRTTPRRAARAAAHHRIAARATGAATGLHRWSTARATRAAARHRGVAAGVARAATRHARSARAAAGHRAPACAPCSAGTTSAARGAPRHGERCHHPSTEHRPGKESHDGHRGRWLRAARRHSPTHVALDPPQPGDPNLRCASPRRPRRASFSSSHSGPSARPDETCPRPPRPRPHLAPPDHAARA